MANDFRADVYLLSPGSATVLFVFKAKITPAHAVEYKRPDVLWSAASERSDICMGSKNRLTGSALTAKRPLIEGAPARR
jgi:hypothetical protein